MPESLNLDVNGSSIKRKKIKNITLEQMIEWIKNRGYDIEITSILINKVSKYPANTYHKFRSDLSIHVKEAQKAKNG